MIFTFFFFNDTATTEIYTLSLHDALPISNRSSYTFTIPYDAMSRSSRGSPRWGSWYWTKVNTNARSEEHTSELQSQSNLVCRLLLEKKKQKAPLPCDGTRACRVAVAHATY